MSSEKVKLLINNDFKNIDDNLKEWTRLNIIEPKKEMLSLNDDGSSLKEFWIVTKGSDSSYRVTYDEDDNIFGLECKLADRIKWYMGPYGTFSEAINNM